MGIASEGEEGEKQSEMVSNVSTEDMDDYLGEDVNTIEDNNGNRVEFGKENENFMLFEEDVSEVLDSKNNEKCRCDKCSVSFSNQESLFHHIDYYHEKKTCDTCSMELSSGRNLKHFFCY